MFKEVEEYIRFLQNFGEVVRPQMPNFDISAYTDSEYTNALGLIMEDYKFVDDYELTIKYLKGE